MKTVFSAGCFDALHEGHLNLLRRLRELGDYVIIGINDDSYFVKKGPNRPIDKEEVRKEKLYNTQLVDEVVVFYDNPLKTILYLKPDIIVAGSDYNEETTIGSKECKSWGGKVIILPRTPGISTTQILNKDNQ